MKSVQAKVKIYTDFSCVPLAVGSKIPSGTDLLSNNLALKRMWCKEKRTH